MSRELCVIEVDGTIVFETPDGERLSPQFYRRKVDYCDKADTLKVGSSYPLDMSSASNIAYTSNAFFNLLLKDKPVPDDEGRGD